MTTDRSQGTPACPKCGAERRGDRCWLCGYRYATFLAGETVAKLSDDAGVELLASEVGPAGAGKKPGREIDEIDSRLVTVLVFVVFIVIFVGLYPQAPVIAILLAIMVIPAFLRTLLEDRYRKRQGFPMTQGEKLLSFTRSLLRDAAVLFVLGLVVFLALVSFLYIVCSGLLGPMR